MKRTGEFKIYSGHGLLQPVYHGALKESGISAEVLEFCHIGGTHRGLSDLGCHGSFLRVYQIQGKDKGNDILPVYYFDADALSGYAGA